MFEKKWKTAYFDFRYVQYDFNHCLGMLFCVCKGEMYCRNMAIEDVLEKNGSILQSRFN